MIFSNEITPAPDPEEPTIEQILERHLNEINLKAGHRGLLIEQLTHREELSRIEGQIEIVKSAQYFREHMTVWGFEVQPGKYAKMQGISNIDEYLTFTSEDLEQRRKELLE